jgi:hypothetical protein
MKKMLLFCIAILALTTSMVIEASAQRGRGVAVRGGGFRGAAVTRGFGGARFGVGRAGWVGGPRFGVGRAGWVGGRRFGVGGVGWVGGRRFGVVRAGPVWGGGWGWRGGGWGWGGPVVRRVVVVPSWGYNGCVVWNGWTWVNACYAPWW